MNAERRSLEKIARAALSGKGAHVEAKEIFAGLTWRAAGSKPRGASHSVYQLLRHMIYWQAWVLRWLQGENPAAPEHASASWPAEAGPSGKREWEAAVEQFIRELAKLERACRGADLSSRRGRKSRLEMIHAIAAHNSYHAGQVVFLRQMLGKWPPPSGGLTW